MVAHGWSYKYIYVGSNVEILMVYIQIYSDQYTMLITHCEHMQISCKYIHAMNLHSYK